MFTIDGAKSCRLHIVRFLVSFLAGKELFTDLLVVANIKPVVVVFYKRFLTAEIPLSMFDASHKTRKKM